MYKLLFILLFFMVHPLTAKGIDPTAPLSGYDSANQGHSGEERLVLEAIIHGDKVHTAVINQKMLKVGDSIRDHKLVAVNDNSVVLRNASETLKLYIFSGVIAK